MRKYVTQMLEEIQADLAQGIITCKSLTEFYLKNIKIHFKTVI